MSFQAKLFVNDEVRNVLNANQIYSRYADYNGRPITKPIGHQLNFSIESTSNDSFFYENMFSETAKCNGEIVFYKRDGLSTLFKIEFANAQILRLSESFDAYDSSPMHINISIGWGIARVRGLIHEEIWNPNNPFVDIEETVIEEEESPQILDFYITDENGNVRTKYKIGDIIFLVIESVNKIGKNISLNLKDKTKDFKYLGKHLPDDIIEDYEIKSNKDIIKLEVVTQE